MSVSLGTDGAPCNNTLDMFETMKLTAILHKVSAGAEVLPAAAILARAIHGGGALHMQRADIGFR